MKTHTKAFLLLLALLMAITSFTACNDEKPADTESQSESQTESDSSTESTTSKTEGSSAQETETDENTSVLDGVRFNGDVLRVFSWTPGNLSEYVESIDENTTMIDQAVFNRCDRAESRLNVRISWNYVPANNQFMETAERENNNGGKYDVFASVSTHFPVLMANGVLSNMTKYKYLDFDHVAWPDSLVDDLTISNKLYFASGDISTNLTFMTCVLFYNKTLMKDLGINEKITELYGAKDIYALVESGKWTWDKVFTLSENVYKDINNNGKKDLGDRFAYTIYDSRFDDVFYGAGCSIVKAEEDGFVVDPSYLDAEFIGNLLTKTNTFFHDTKDGYIGSDYIPIKDEFAAGHAVFSAAPASHAWHTYSNTEELDYGALVVPKWNESQAAYTCTQSIQFTMYALPSQSAKQEVASAFLQALAEEAYNYTRPASIDKLMKGRYAELPEDAAMWEYAINANVFDMARLFTKLYQEDTGTLIEGLFRDLAMNDNSNWSKVLDTWIIPLTLATAKLTSQISALPD